MAERVNIGDATAPDTPVIPEKRWRITQRTRDNVAGFLFIAPWLVHFFVLIAGAMAFSFIISLTKTDLLSESSFVGFDNYSRIV